MPQTVSLTELARRFAEYVNRVAYRGETFVLLRGRKPIAELRPLPQGRRLGDLPQLLAGLPHLSESQAARFSDDLDEARAELRENEVRDPWQS